MNKKEFMGSLEKHLKYLPKEDKKDALDYYAEYIEDSGFAEGEDISAKLGNPKDIAKNIIAECAQKRIDKQEGKKSAKGGAVIVWMVILGIFSLPITLPLAITIFALFLTLVIVIFSVLLSLGIIALSLMLIGIFTLFITLFAPGIGQKLVIIGLGICVSSIGLLLLIGVIKLSELSVRVIGLIGKKILGKFKKEK